MKKYILILFLTASTFCAKAQWTINGSGDAINNNSSGKVGIGTNTPGYKLELQTSSPTKAAYFQTTGSWQAIDFSSDGGTSKGSLSAAGGLLGIGSAASGTNSFLNINLTSGNVGIGTNTPGYKLELQTSSPTKAAYFQTTGSWQAIDFSSDGGTSKGSLSAAGGLLGIGSAASGTNSFLNINLTSGNVGIGTGTNAPDAKLAVKGQVHAQEVKVDLTGAIAPPDYVFEKDYKLTSLEEIKNYIDQNKHLPEVPSAKEIEKNGIQLGEMNLLLLKKIEELTLYVIEQNERLSNLEKENSELIRLIKK